MIFIINDSEHSMDCLCFGCDFFLQECRLLTSIIELLVVVIMQLSFYS